MSLKGRSIIRSTAVAALTVLTVVSSVVMTMRAAPQPAQSASVTETTTLESVTRDYLARLHTGFDQIQDAEVDAVRIQRLENELTARIHTVVDAFVAEAFDPRRIDRKTVAESVRRVFPRAALYDPVFAFVGEMPGGGRRLAIVYSLLKDHNGHASSLTVRMYEEVDARFRYVDAIGGFDHYSSISVVELRPPVVGDMHFLVWGKVTTANGPNTGMRIYAYDGQRFRTVWEPENVWGNFTVDVQPRGFTVKGSYYREDRLRDEEYLLTADGVLLIKQ